MNTNFAGVVEEVKHLSFDEKLELKQLLENYLIEERREEIAENYEKSVVEFKKGELTFSSNSGELKEMLND